MANSGGNPLNKELFPQNIGNFDRMLRFLLGIFLLAFGYFWTQGGVFEYILYVLAFVLTFTSITGNDLLYTTFHVNTVETKQPVRETLTLLILFYIILIPVLMTVVKSYVSSLSVR